jgi:ATP-dependent DNA helicase UvrD/PcrA
MLKKMAFFTPTIEQQNIINTDCSALVTAGPGTGKTRTAIEKAKLYCARLDPSKRQRVLFLSFSNAAVRRLTDAAAVIFSRHERRMLRFMTYHSYAAELLRLYGRFTGLPPRVQIMDTIEQDLTLLERSIEVTDENKIVVLNALAKEGRLGFDVLIPSTVALLQNTPKLRAIVSRNHPLVIIDEFQDTSEDQWRMLQLIGSQCQVVAFGDPNQIIYSSLYGATVSRFEGFLAWKGLRPSSFSRNKRCEQTDILEFAEALLKAKPYVANTDGALKLVPLQYRRELRSKLAAIWKKIQQGGAGRSVGIVVPSNTIADEIAVALRSPPKSSPVKIPVFARIIADGAAYDSILLALVAFRDYGVEGSAASLRKFAVALHAMDIHWNRRIKRSPKKVIQLEKSIKTLLTNDKARLSLLLPTLPRITDFNQMVPEFISAVKQVKKLEGTCGRIASHGRLPLPRFISTEQFELFDSLRQSRTIKGLDGYETSLAGTEIITYHRAKGREFDFVLMVVDPREESSKPTIDEAQRLYYVCATRAKQWLGVLYYPTEPGRVLRPVLALQ